MVQALSVTVEASSRVSTTVLFRQAGSSSNTAVKKTVIRIVIRQLLATQIYTFFRSAKRNVSPDSTVKTSFFLIFAIPTPALVVEW